METFIKHINKHMVAMGITKKDILARFSQDKWEHDKVSENSITSTQEVGWIYLHTTYRFDGDNRLKNYSFIASGPGVTLEAYRRFIDLFSAKYQIKEDPRARVLGAPNRCLFSNDNIGGSLDFDPSMPGADYIAVCFSKKKSP